MNVLYICGSYYQYPFECKSLEEFIGYINSSNTKFVSLVRYESENCVFPYFIEEETKKVYLNFSQIVEIEEAEIKVLKSEEYEERLAECVDDVCKYCTNYIEDSEDDNMKGHRNKINLDGECFWKQNI